MNAELERFNTSINTVCFSEGFKVELENKINKSKIERLEAYLDFILQEPMFNNSERESYKNKIVEIMK